MSGETRGNSLREDAAGSVRVDTLAFVGPPGFVYDSTWPRDVQARFRQAVFYTYNPTPAEHGGHMARELASELRDDADLPREAWREARAVHNMLSKWVHRNVERPAETNGRVVEAALRKLNDVLALVHGLADLGSLRLEADAGPEHAERQRRAERDYREALEAEETAIEEAIKRLPAKSEAHKTAPLDVRGGGTPTYKIPIAWPPRRHTDGVVDHKMNMFLSEGADDGKGVVRYTFDPFTKRWCAEGATA